MKQNDMLCAGGALMELHDEFYCPYGPHQRVWRGRFLAQITDLFVAIFGEEEREES